MVAESSQLLIKKTSLSSSSRFEGWGELGSHKSNVSRWMETQMGPDAPPHVILTTHASSARDLQDDCRMTKKEGGNYHSSNMKAPK